MIRIILPPFCDVKQKVRRTEKMSIDEYCIFSSIKSDMSRRDLSLGAKAAITTLRVMIGYKAFFSISLQKISEAIGCPLASTRRYLKELQDKGLLGAHMRHNHPNSWYLADMSCKRTPDCSPVSTQGCDCSPVTAHQRTVDCSPVSTIKDSLKEQENVNVGDPTPNVIEAAPPEEERKTPPSILPMVNEIERVTRDMHSRRAFIRVATNVGEDDIRYALDQVSYGCSQGSVHNPGAYFLRIIFDRTGYSPSNGFADQRPSVTPPRVEPEVREEARPEVNPTLVSELRKLRENRASMTNDDFARRVAEVTERFGSSAMAAATGGV